MDLSSMELWQVALLCYGAAMVIAFIICHFMASGLTTVRPQEYAHDYVVQGSFDLTLERDDYAGKRVDRVAKPQQQSQGRPRR